MAGMEQGFPGIRCERARHWASLRLDGELSALEDELLERHLASCDACCAFAAGVGTAASLLRATPPETPLRSFQLARSSRARSRLVGRHTALVAAAALVLGAVTGSLLNRPASAPAPIRAPQVSLLSRDMKQLRELPRNDTNTTPPPVRSGPPNPPEGVI
jgi:putative zinc finger protein